MIERTRCSWCLSHPLYVEYHDKEWGIPVHDDQKIFEFLILESMQAGLNWFTILKKRENFRKAFSEFNPEKVARFNEKKIESLMQDAGIIRHEKKIRAAINNAKVFLSLKEKHESFDNYIWHFVEGKPIKNRWKALSEIPASTAVSDKMSKELKKQGFQFLGSTICYAHMQATGMVNDHLVTCFCY